MAGSRLIPARVGVVDVTPSASRLTRSLRDIGYDFPSAVADLVDNSICAGSKRVDIELCFEGAKSYVLVADDGSGMTDNELVEALRFGSRRRYGSEELGKFGLGLKTASLSQCRRVTVVTRRSPTQRRIAAHTLDMDHIEISDRWEVVDVPSDTYAHRAKEWLDNAPGTVVVWELLDRALPGDTMSGGWAQRRLNSHSDRTTEHLSAVFHRFLEGIDGADPLVITVNGRKLEPWNPFAPDEKRRLELPKRRYEVFSGEVAGYVTMSPYVLPARSLFSSLAQFELLGGRGKWNRQQGFYIYRANRLIQSGGWCGIRGIDEHTKLARAALDFSTELDELFRINVAKMRVQLPTEIRSLMRLHIADLCQRAQEMYRRDLREGKSSPSVSEPIRMSNDASSIGAAILSAAMATGQAAALDTMIRHLEAEAPEIVSRLGW
jgi:hypothetical protein